MHANRLKAGNPHEGSKSELFSEGRYWNEKNALVSILALLPPQGFLGTLIFPPRVFHASILNLKG